LRNELKKGVVKMVKEILVPVDGSEDANKALESAADTAVQNNANLHLLYVAKRVSLPKDLESYVRSEGIKESPKAFYFEFLAEQILDAAEARARGKGVKKIERDMVLGDPAEEIVKYAHDQYFDMIVMGSREMGSVATKVCRATDRTCVVVRKGLLEGKRILIVDDEPDVLETLAELLEMCDVTEASSFEEAKKLLETQAFDMAVLDIMGVDGYMLLEIANDKKVIAVMLTAHALSPEHTVKSFEEGAASYVPKDKMVHIATYLNDILEAQEKGKHFWWRWFERFGEYYERTFGSAPSKKIRTT
jgi:nucleotide-binding universal stress UspA family protein/CheY-like chemotaxis protein